ncbi:MAG: winged helix DNA-binding protein [Hyphomicrobiales bacterium]|nr:winged helix DNA-binding protein [Hyphomicrobiales bacterium]
MDAQLPKGLSTSHFGVLNHLVRLGDGRTPLEISRAFQVAKTTMTHTLSGLEHHRLVEMRANEKDGRSKCIWLTDKGRQLRDRTIADLIPGMEELAEQLPPGHVAPLVAELIKLRVYLDSNRKEVVD